MAAKTAKTLPIKRLIAKQMPGWTSVNTPASSPAVTSDSVGASVDEVLRKYSAAGAARRKGNRSLVKVKPRNAADGSPRYKNRFCSQRQSFGRSRLRGHRPRRAVPLFGFAPNVKENSGAGDRGRTGDVQLGNMSVDCK